VRELSVYGPMKKPDSVGIDDILEKYQGAQIAKSDHYQPDPSGLRCGNGPGPEIAKILELVAKSADDAVDSV
jgi:hypothetical protein